MSRVRRGMAILLLVLSAGASLASDHTLRLAEFSFDPLAGLPALPEGWAHSLSASPDLHLVQFDGPIPGGALDLLRSAGVEPVRYIHPDTYVVWGRQADRDRLSGRARIRWTGDFAPAFRVQAALRESTAPSVDVRVLVYRGAGVDAVMDALSRMGTEVGTRTIIDDRLAIAGLRLSGSLVRRAAAVPGVYSIQPNPGEWASRAEVSDQINVGNLDENGIAVPGYRDWLASVNLDGTGVSVAVVDEGIDQSHPDLAAGRLPCTGPSCTDAPSLHGTHVAGIVTGDGASGATDVNGFLRGLGVAPGTSYLEQEFVMFRFLAGGVSELIADSRRNGATISTNSWGTSNAARGYDADALMIDAGVRDADPLAAGNQPLLYVQAIANGQGGISSQGSPEEAKNVLVVGSTKAINADDDNPSPDVDDLSSNSAHGPALDGRTIPHVVAPGCRVDSTTPDYGQGPEWTAMCGTSMAAPQVTGAAALFTQFYRRLPGVTSDPSPALVKAAILATARDLQGYRDADGAVMGHRPDSKQGWGRLDLRSLVTPPAGSVIYVDQTRIFEETGENWLREVRPVDSGRPMRVFLAWTDAPGHGLGGSTPAWNNDLDLAVDAGGSTYLGNVFGPDGWSAPGGVADGKHNAEGVFLAVAPAHAVIRVTAANVNSDGVPRSGDELDQDFALVCVNCAFEAGFDLDPAPVTSRTCAPRTAAYDVRVEQHAGYADPVTLAASGLPAGVSASFDVNPVTPGGTSRLTVDPGALGDGNYPFTLTGTAPGITRTHPLYLQRRTGAPISSTLLSPAAGATGVSPQPTLEWSAVPWAEEYVVEVSTDPTFATIAYSAATAAPTHRLGIVLKENTLYRWRVRARNVCGVGAFSATWEFTTRNVPDVLLVDDDWDYWGDYQALYRADMDALPQAPYNYPVTYDVWDVYAVMAQKEPDYPALALYDKVVWWSGKEDFYAGPLHFSEVALRTWMDRSGGCPLISSSDYVFARGEVTEFMAEKLGVGSVVQDTGHTSVTGQGAVFGSLGTITLKNANPDYSDRIVPDATAEVAFTNAAAQPAGVDKNGGFYGASFLGFGIERMSTEDNRRRTLLKFLQWCDGLAAVDGDGDGVANGADCVAGDAQAWTAPSPVTDLSLSKATGFAWSQPVSGGGAVYDLVRGTDPRDFWNAACVASGTAERTVAWSADGAPAPGGIFYYLVRARSGCGTAPMGARSDGTPRQGTACQ